jgi:hypothetical protein
LRRNPDPDSEEKTMTVDISTLDQYDNKQVILHVAQQDGSAKEMEGKVEAGSPIGVAFKEKGKRDVEFIEPNDIVEIALAPDKPKNISQRKLKPITDTQARQHLVDRHGFLRSQVNKMTDDEAFKEHNAIDHDDLGHRHVSEDDDENGEDSGEE